MRTYEFNVDGMKCENCVQSILGALSAEGDISEVAVGLGAPNIRFNSAGEFNRERVGQVLAPLKKYKVLPTTQAPSQNTDVLKTLTLYWPLILLFLLSAGIPAIRTVEGGFGFDMWMHQFMGIVLISLSYFKLLDLPKFADGFSTYDPIASRFHGYGYIYPFLELLSGIAFLMAFSIQLISVLVIVYLSITTYGVVRALAEKRQFQCACLGTVFKLPLTKITIIENIVMIGMSLMIVI